MILSLNELKALSLKAARGSGIPLGHAEDFARAVSMLAQIRPDDLACVYLTLLGDEPLAVPFALDQLQCGATEVPLIGSPLIHGYVAQRALETDTAIMWNGTSICLGSDMPVAKVGPVDVPDAIYNALNEFAQLTYVPATAESRAGAGAGAIDND